MHRTVVGCLKQMNYLTFAYWLQGYFELENPNSLNEFVVEKIKDHLKITIDDILKPYITPESTLVAWLSNFLETKKDCDSHQTADIKDKLSVVFKKVTPNYLDSQKASFEEIMTGKFKEWPYEGYIGNGEGFLYPWVAATC